MRLHTNDGPGVIELERFLGRNGLAGATVHVGETGITIELPDELALSEDLRAALERHMSFTDLFYWVANGLEDVAFWDKPRRWPDVARELERFYPAGTYDVLATLESRGFFVAGALSHILAKPVIPVRKYREAFSGYPGHMTSYLNWRGRRDRLWMQHYPWLDRLPGSRALFVDDVIETGNSLAAAVELLCAVGMAPMGAFYLADAANDHVRGRFRFPVRSLLRFDDLQSNTAPAAATVAGASEEN